MLNRCLGLLLVSGYFGVCGSLSAASEVNFRIRYLNEVEDENQSAYTVDICVELESGERIDVGKRKIFNYDEKGYPPGYLGVDPESLKVKKLDLESSVFLVTWSDYVQGHGGYQYSCYHVVSIGKSVETLLLGGVLKRGRWGGGTGQFGSFSLECQGNKLVLVVQWFVQDRSHIPRPYYNKTKWLGGDEHYIWAGSSRVTQNFELKDGSLTLIKTRYEFKAINADIHTVEDVCDALSVERPWVLNPEVIALWKNGLEIEFPSQEFIACNDAVVIELPLEESVKRFPFINVDENYDF